MRYFFLLVVLCIFPNIAFAHSSNPSGFVSGLTHPVLGLDHLLAMVSVGIISAQFGGRAVILVPVTFVVSMMVGGLVSLYGYSNFNLELSDLLVEQGIMLSVIVLGLAIAMDKNVPIGAAVFVTALFAFFHGYAHGSEIPYLSSSTTYILGFMLGTSLLHVFGVGIGVVAQRLKSGMSVLRYAGASILGAGLHMMYENLLMML